MTGIPNACPDGGTCHHDCAAGCFRVLYAAPLGRKSWTEAEVWEARAKSRSGPETTASMFGRLVAEEDPGDEPRLPRTARRPAWRAAQDGDRDAGLLDELPVPALSLVALHDAQWDYAAAEGEVTDDEQRNAVRVIATPVVAAVLRALLDDPAGAISRATIRALADRLDAPENGDA